jgi:molybdenum cofactor cytidylyltransferase
MGERRALVAGVVLAAGRGSRLSTTKQLLPLEGLPLVAHAVAAAEESRLADVVVVLGHEADAVLAALALRRARVVRNPRFAEGQSTSLQAGLLALGPHIEAAVILLGDQPGVRPAVIDALIAARGAGPAGASGGPEEGPLALIPTYEGRDGHPVLLERELWPEVMDVRGDEGARSVLRAHAAQVLRLAVPGSAPRDVDTPDDYAALRAAFGEGAP